MSERRPRPWEFLVLLLSMAFLGWWQWAYRGYVKDDTFISLRYARNLSEGLGLHFNPGERLEGYTNFLWVLLCWPAFELGIDPLSWAKALACLFGQLGVVVTWLLARQLAGGPDPRALIAPVLWASSSSVVLWSMGGLEPTFMACSVGLALLAMLHLLETDGDPRRAAHGLGAALLLACLCRPDAHAFLLVAAAAAALDWHRRGAIRPVWVRAAGIVVAGLVPYHAFRMWYFGDPLPNTYYVKAAAGPEVWKSGVEFVGSLIGFNANPGVFAFAALALILPGNRRARIVLGLAVCGFLLYLVKIGRDEMKWFRLFLPVYPAALALAADGLRTVLDRFGALLRPRAATAVSLAVTLAAGGAGAAVSNELTREKAAWHGQYLEWSKDSFGAMGRYIAERSKPGEAVVFQDMGAAPFAAPEQRWLDTIGILNHFVAHELAAIRLNPFMRSERAKEQGGRKLIEDFDRRVREYMFEQDPAWIAFVAYVSRDQRGFANKIRAADGDAEELDRIFRRAVASNTHAHGISKDPRFLEGFRYEAHWQRNREYWLVLYRRIKHTGPQ